MAALTRFSVLLVAGVALGLLATGASPLPAQRTVTVGIAVGARVRTQLSGDTVWRVARLVSPGPDTLRVKACDTCPLVAYPLSTLSAVEVSVGRSSRGSTVLFGAFLGAIVGAVGGWLWASYQTRDCPGNASNCGLAFLAVYGYGAIGFVVGGVVGAMFRYDDWRPALIH